MAGDEVHFWLWLFTVATAIAGGALSLWGSVLQRKEPAPGTPVGRGYRLVMGSYVLMTVSIVTFVVRGLV